MAQVGAFQKLLDARDENQAAAAVRAFCDNTGLSYGLVGELADVLFEYAFGKNFRIGGTQGQAKEKQTTATQKETAPKTPGRKKKETAQTDGQAHERKQGTQKAGNGYMDWFARFFPAAKTAPTQPATPQPPPQPVSPPKPRLKPKPKPISPETKQIREEFSINPDRCSLVVKRKDIDERIRYVQATPFDLRRFFTVDKHIVASLVVERATNVVSGGARLKLSDLTAALDEAFGVRVFAINGCSSLSEVQSRLKTSVLDCGWEVKLK